MLRLTNTYGPRMRVRDARQTFLGIWLRLVWSSDEPIQVCGDGSQRRDFTYVDDAVARSCSRRRGTRPAAQVYNLGGDEIVSLRELAELLVELNGGGSFELVPFPAERKAIDIGDYYADFSRIRRELGWEPQVGLREGLPSRSTFYRAQRAVLGLVSVPFLDLRRGTPRLCAPSSTRRSRVLASGQFVLGRRARGVRGGVRAVLRRRARGRRRVRHRRDHDRAAGRRRRRRATR